MFLQQLVLCIVAQFTKENPTFKSVQAWILWFKYHFIILKNNELLLANIFFFLYLNLWYKIFIIDYLFTYFLLAIFFSNIKIFIYEFMYFSYLIQGRVLHISLYMEINDIGVKTEILVICWKNVPILSTSFILWHVFLMITVTCLLLYNYISINKC